MRSSSAPLLSSPLLSPDPANPCRSMSSSKSTMNPRCEDRSHVTGVSTRSLVITVISAEDLRIKGKHFRNNAFAVVKAESCPDAITKVDPEGGSYPYWNEKLLVDLPLHAGFITVEVRRFSDGEQLIGAARIPVSDFVGGYVPENYLHFLSYRLRDAAGERNGIINVSVRARTWPATGCSTSSQPEMGVPVGLGNGGGGGTVTGVPIWRPVQPCKSQLSGRECTVHRKFK